MLTGSIFWKEWICGGLVHINIICGLVQQYKNPVVVKNHLSDLEKTKWNLHFFPFLIQM